MDIYPEIELSQQQHVEIEILRNQSFPEHQVPRSYFKQLPHMRALKYHNNQLIGYMGLDYRVVRVGEAVYKVLGIIDFCIDKVYQGQGVGSSMLCYLHEYASSKEVDFVILLSDLHHFYTVNGYQRVDTKHSWLRLDEHRNYGVAVEQVDDLYVKPIRARNWSAGDLDWLGYMY